MKPTVDSIIAKYNIRPYNGSWYVQEKKLREVLEQVIDEAYMEGEFDLFAMQRDLDDYEPVTRHFKD